LAKERDEFREKIEEMMREIEIKEKTIKALEE
jgi:hypothetical protein